MANNEDGGRGRNQFEPWLSCLSSSLIETRRPFAYQAIAKEALTLHSLGMSAAAIARALNVTDGAVTKAIRRAESMPPLS